MRVLIYGGCHATILSQLLAEAAPGHSFAPLTNFELIASGTPFPLDRLTQIDALVYSPIRNQGAWNTDGLAARCRELGIRSMSYPWLQFNGMFPGVIKMQPPASGHIWDFQFLAAGSALTAQQITDFCAYSLDQLREHEADTDVTISPYVRAHFQQKRLFATPDHPALPIYHEVMRQLAEALPLELGPLDLAGPAPHPDRLPIFTEVQQALGLAYGDETYVSPTGTIIANRAGYEAEMSRARLSASAPAG